MRKKHVHIFPAGADRFALPAGATTHWLPRTIDGRPGRSTMVLGRPPPLRGRPSNQEVAEMTSGTPVFARDPETARYYDERAGEYDEWYEDRGRFAQRDR